MNFITSLFTAPTTKKLKANKKKPMKKQNIVHANHHHHLDQRSPIQRSQLDFNNYLMRDDTKPTQVFLSKSEYYEEGITDDIYMMGKMTSDSMIVLTRKGRIYVHVEQKWKPVDLEHEFVVDFEISPINVILKTRLGNLYGATTYNTWNQAGTTIGSPSMADLRFELVQRNDELVDVKTGYGHSYFLDMNRELYFCGNSGFGQLACSGDRAHDMTKISNSKIKGRRVKIIASGFANCLAVFEDGNGLVWGNNDHKQLGYEKHFCITNPKPLDLPSDNEIIGLSAGQNISLAMTIAHEIFIAGSFMGTIDVWRKIVEIDFSPQSIFDAYIIYNDVYILSTSKLF
ncbi:predicted protein [Naegleria gruberi]|uniref:Predicted protein n=1 Tax=Naegleria gruberi TaxID=5762 RepID=D2VW21_NAEGR|nr:uncharacterized protein NAEGRDRAFT_52706 [Naegleria gruberi]EFC39003.1 predicted protein [Naegleria gruberi]|eukprot:XP_002671747.1 predicted protein [Naegleria gruberi strain NEG-M]